MFAPDGPGIAPIRPSVCLWWSFNISFVFSVWDTPQLFTNWVRWNNWNKLLMVRQPVCRYSPPCYEPKIFYTHLVPNYARISFDSCWWQMTLRLLPTYITIWYGINANYCATFDLGIILGSMENWHIFHNIQDRLFKTARIFKKGT